MLVATLVLLTTASPVAEVWKGDFTFKVTGTGKATGPKPNRGDWEIYHEARGTIILDRTFDGGGIAGAPDSNNTKRYKTWVSTSKRPIEMRIKDRIGIYGPLFAANQIRQDTIRYTCPPDGADAWMPGKVGTPILQFDLDKGLYQFESPRIYAKTTDYFRREFVAGPRAWTSKKPIDKSEVNIEFEIIHGLNQPKEWFKMDGPYKPDQDKIVLTRKLPFQINLGASIPAQNLNAEFKLVLEKKPL